MEIEGVKYYREEIAKRDEITLQQIKEVAEPLIRKEISQLKNESIRKLSTWTKNWQNMVNDFTSDNYLKFHFDNDKQKNKDVLVQRIDEFLADIYICKVLYNADGLKTETNLRNILRREKFGSKDYDLAVAWTLSTVRFLPGFKKGVTFREIIRKELRSNFFVGVVIVGVVVTVLSGVLYLLTKKKKNAENKE